MTRQLREKERKALEEGYKKGLRFIARDESGALYMYDYKTKKYDGYWRKIEYDYFLYVSSRLSFLSFITSKDEGPHEIAKLLES